MYDSWASHIRLFIKWKKHGRMMLNSIDNGPLVYLTVEENRQTRPMKYSELIEAQQLQDDCDVQATNIILHGLPPNVYALVNHQESAKDIWDRVKLLMKGTELSYQEHECRLYNLFDKFAYQVQINTKFLNALPLEWSKFVTNVKLAKSLYTTNYDQLRASGETVYSAKTARNAAWFKGDLDTEDLDAYDSYCDDLSLAKAVLMANLSSCDPEVLSEIMRYIVIVISFRILNICKIRKMRIENELRKLKGKNVVDTAVSKPNATIALGIEKLVVVTPMNKDKRVRFAEPDTSSSNIPKQIDSLKTKDFNKPLFTSTGVKPTTSASGSKPSGNTKNNRIM
ncbi:hypothetical protein Tco_0854460 [Tanacetum coccineum]